MNYYNLSSNISNIDIDNEEASLESSNFNNYILPSSYIILNMFDFNFDNTSNLNFYDTNDKSQGILIKNDKTKVHKNAFKQNCNVENYNNKKQAFNSLENIEENKNNKNMEDNNKNNNNSNIIVGINYEDKIENRNIIFNIFNGGEYDNYSTNMINETLNDLDKKCRKIKKIKKLFIQSPKKIRKKKKNIEHRKGNADNIRKKIKVKFHKILKNTINEKLKKAGSKYIFKALPQSFITNITKNLNRQFLNLPIKDLFSVNFNGKERDNKDYNLFVLEYLDNHNDISEKANFNIIKNMKYEDAFNEYLFSKEFKIVISTLKKDENDKYIKDYIIKAYSLINFFKNDKKKKKNIFFF